MLDLKECRALDVCYFDPLAHDGEACRWAGASSGLFARMVLVQVLGYLRECVPGNLFPLGEDVVKIVGVGEFRIIQFIVEGIPTENLRNFNKFMNEGSG